MANTIGIDFGTTKTMVSYLNPVTGRPELVRLGRDRDSIPTTIHIDENGGSLFGEDADDQIEMDPDGYGRAFKIHLGENDPFVPSRSNETAESIAARFLHHIKEECEKSVFHGDPVTSATITIPVSFAPARKASLKRAAEAAGFSSVSFMPEPEAAGTAFLRDNPSDKFSRALVLDWGGGTLDVAIISRDEDGKIHADRHCVEGCEDIGGEEMDRGLFENLKIMWEQATGTELVSSEESEPKLLREAEKVKIGLSRKESVPFRRGREKIDITRDKFRRIVEDLLQVSVEFVQSALSKNKAKGHPDPDAILLIGGTSQSPVVRETMELNFRNLRVLSWHHSHEAVALGATAACNAEGVDLQNNFDRRNANMSPPVRDAFRREVVYNTVPIKQQRCWKSGMELEDYVRESKTLHEDSFYFLRAMLNAGWRLNAVHTSALALADELEKIGENEDSTVISLRVRQGLNAIAFDEFDDIIKTIADSTSELVKEIAHNSDDYVELYPQLKSISIGPGLVGIKEKSFKKEVEKQLRQLQNVYNDVCCKYNMLCEGFARYDKIMAGGSFWKKALLGGGNWLVDRWSRGDCRCGMEWLERHERQGFCSKLCKCDSGFSCYMRCFY